MSHGGPGNNLISFTVDGQTLSVADKHQTAGKLLELAGLDPAQFDLAKTRGHEGQPYRDDQQVVVKQGDAFVSVRQSAQVA
jgi:hypothetical protein